jgi:hypothetical protein
LHRAIRIAFFFALDYCILYAEVNRVLIEDSLMNSIRASELVFEVTEEAEGGYSAECLTENIVTQANTWEELRANVKEATEAYFYNGSKPKCIRLHLDRNEVLTTG